MPNQSYKRADELDLTDSDGHETTTHLGADIARATAAGMLAAEAIYKWGLKRPRRACHRFRRQPRRISNVNVISMQLVVVMSDDTTSNLSKARFSRSTHAKPFATTGSEEIYAVRT